MSDVSVQFIGSGDAFGSGGRFQTCFLVRAGSGQALIDCGASSLVALKQFGIACSGIDLILLSHLHGDHFGGLPFFLLDAHYVSRRERPLTIAGPPGMIDRIKTTLEALFPGSGEIDLRFPVKCVELPEGTNTAFGDWRVTPHAVIHPSGAPAYGLRVEVDGKLIAYSGDTGWTDNLLRIADGADLFICECYMFGKQVKYHLSYQELDTRRTDFNCREMILTHMGAEIIGRLDEIDIAVAHDGKVIDL